MTKPFAAAVKEKMAEQGLGLRELCRLAGVDPSFLSKILAGKRSPPWEEAPLRRLAQALAMDPLRLIVAAGRIPSEWGALASDEDRLRAVHRLATQSAAPSISPAPVRQKPPEPRPTERSREGVPSAKAVRARPRIPREALSEELL
jgi:transcriptional regulator with XRE-family HTH domain